MTRLETIKTILEANSSASWRIEQIKGAIFSDKINRYSQISNLPNTMRQDFGTDINAACGQLAATYKKTT